MFATQTYQVWRLPHTKKETGSTSCSRNGWHVFLSRFYYDFKACGSVERCIFLDGLLLNNNGVDSSTIRGSGLWSRGPIPRPNITGILGLVQSECYNQPIKISNDSSLNSNDSATNRNIGEEIVVDRLFIMRCTSTHWLNLLNRMGVCFYLDLVTTLKHVGVLKEIFFRLTLIK